MKARTIRVNEAGEIDLTVFDDLLDISQVVYYEITGKVGGGIIIMFYDKYENLIQPYAGKRK